MLGKKIFQNYIFQLLNQIVGLVASILVARLGGAAIFGNIGLATSYQNLFKSLIVNSTNNAHLKIHSENDYHGIKTYAIVVFILILVSDFTIFSWAIYNYFSPVGLTSLQSILILLFILQDFITLPCLIATTDCTARLDILRANIASFLPLMLINIFKILAIIVGYREIGIAVFMVIASFLGNFYSIYILKKRYWGSFNIELAKKYLRYSLYILSGAIAYGLLLSYDKILLGFLRVSAEDLGYYNAGNKIGIIFMQMGVSIGGLFLAVFTKNAINKDSKSTINILIRYERYVLSFFLPFVLALLLCGKDLLILLFGDDFSKGSAVLGLSLLIALMKIITIPYHNLLLANNRFRLFNILAGIYALSIITIPTLFAIINWFDDILFSVAFGLFLTGVFEKFLFSFSSKRINRKIKLIYNLHFFLYFITCFIISEWIFTEFISELLMIHRFIYVFIVTLISLAVGFMIKLYKKEDIIHLRTLIGL